MTNYRDIVFDDVLAGGARLKTGLFMCLNGRMVVRCDAAAALLDDIVIPDNDKVMGFKEFIAAAKQSKALSAAAMKTLMARYLQFAKWGDVEPGIYILRAEDAVIVVLAEDVADMMIATIRYETLKILYQIPTPHVETVKHRIWANPANMGLDEVVYPTVLRSANENAKEVADGLVEALSDEPRAHPPPGRSMEDMFAHFGVGETNTQR